MDPISVIFTIAEDLLPAVLQKMRAGQTLQVDVYDARQQEEACHREPSPRWITRSTRPPATVRMRATFDNKDSSLFPSQFVNIKTAGGAEKTG